MNNRAIKVPVAPLPEEVIQRQDAIRRARQETATMYQTHTNPYAMGSPEYDYFVDKLYA